MTLKQVMTQLKKMGTAQNRKIYLRHGATEPLFGVSFANLYTLQKKLQGNHALAMELWETGNSDAQTLALLIADPTQLTKKQATNMIKVTEFYMISGYVGSLVAKAPFWRELLNKWISSEKEFTKAAGYRIVAASAQNGQLTKTEGKKLLKTIQKEMHDSPNRARYSMNNALICIGSYMDLYSETIAAAKSIGVVHVDHGQTSCKTPDAIPYMKKVRDRLAKKKSDK